VRRCTQILKALLILHVAASGYLALLSVIAARSATPWYPEREIELWAWSFDGIWLMLIPWMWIATRELERRSPRPLSIKPLFAALLCVLPILLAALYPLDQLLVRSSRVPPPQWGTASRIISFWTGFVGIGGLISGFAIWSMGLATDLAGKSANLLGLALGQSLWLVAVLLLLLIVARIDRQLTAMQAA
jgi:hypothetical protein